MGVTIHYRGRLRSAGDIQAHSDEAARIAASHRWQVHRFADGVILGPHRGCEPLFLVFHDDGRLHGLFGDEWSFCKTQFAPVEVHVQIVDLLRHLQERFYEDFEVIDDGEYWETGDLVRLTDHLRVTSAAIDSVAEALSEAPAPPPDAPPEELAERIEDAIQQRLWGET